MTTDTCHVLVLSASLREESLNTRLARLSARTIEQGGHAAELASLREFAVGPYDGDEEQAVGLPAGAQELRRRLEGTDAEAEKRYPHLKTAWIEFLGERPEPIIDRVE